MATTAPEKVNLWRRITVIEPRVAELIADAEQLGGGDWDDYRWYKSVLSRFVGWSARDARLRDSECYELCIGRLVEALRL